MAVEKLKSQRGETLLEVLASMVVLTIGMIILAGAIVSAGQINQRVDQAGKQELPGSSEGTAIKVNVQLDESPVSFDCGVFENILNDISLGK